MWAVSLNKVKLKNGLVELPIFFTKGLTIVAKILRYHCFSIKGDRLSLQTSCGSACSTCPKLIFSCSGATDVGELADHSARTLTRNGDGEMFCLAGIGGRVNGMLKATEAAASILAIDGCTLDCTKKSQEEAGFTKINHLRLTDLGFEKGNTDVNSKSIAMVVDKAKSFLSE